MRCVAAALIAVAACGGPAPTPPPTVQTPPAVEPARRDLAVPTMPKGLTVHAGTLVWADEAGAIWTMPADGGAPPRQLSDQHRDGFAFHPFVAGDRVFARIDKDLLAITLPSGPVAHLHIAGLPELPETAVADASSIYVTLFQRDQVMRVPAAGGPAQRVIDFPRGVLALHGDTLYLASYRTGALVAVPTAGGALRKVAHGLARPTALAADARAVYVYTEADQRVTRIDLATGASTTLADHLVNSDELVPAGDDLLTVSWPNRLVQLSTTPRAAPRTLADDLVRPRSIALDNQHIYVTTDHPPRIVVLRR